MFAILILAKGLVEMFKNIRVEQVLLNDSKNFTNTVNVVHVLRAYHVE